MLAVVFGLCLLAQDLDANAQQRMARDIYKWQVEHAGEATATHSAFREANYEEQQFVDKFNHLLETLRDFADQYNHHVVDVKKIKALKKAWRDLEKSDAWLRLNEPRAH